jgi:DNA-binding SARP family transcriptional activator
MIRVHTLGRFAIAVNGKPLVFPGRMPHKALAMLKMIIAAGERGASAEEITDSLWPDAEGDLAATSFDTTLHRLRKLIAHDEAICFQNGILSLDARYCWVDARAFERIAEKADAASKKWGTSGVEALRHMEKAMDLYHGPFLSDDAAEPWTLSAREQLRNKYFDILIHSARLMMQAGKDEQAIERLRKGLDADDLSEELYQQLMLCYQKRGQQAEVVKVYRRCRAMLEREFGLEPSEKTEEIYRIIKTK